MFFQSVAICLLSLSSCVSSARVLDTYIPLPSFKGSAPRTDIGLVSSYNFKDEIDYSYFQTSGSVSYVFEYQSFNNLISLSSNGTITSGSIWSLARLDVEWFNGGPYLDLDFYIYNGYGQTTFDIRFNFGETLSQSTTTYKDLIINFNQTLYVHGVEAEVFDCIFTYEDNLYTKTYTGYYNFSLGLTSVPNPVTVFGSMSFDDKLFKLVTNQSNGALGGPSALLFLGFDVKQLYYVYNVYTLPFNDSEVVSNNILFNSCKMSTTTYQNLSDVGIFAFKKDTAYDDTDFQGLLFTIADVPVYFLSQFLNFELFGLNLFIALSGIITLIIVTFIIRKLI